MLNAIHDKFGGSDGLFGRLIDEEQPAITFQLLDLENFGLSDDLYIKMTARGKPLTAFETFKARYEQELARCSLFVSQPVSFMLGLPETANGLSKWQAIPFDSVFGNRTSARNID